MTRFSSFLLAGLLLGSSLAQAASSDPVWKTVRSGDTPAVFAKRYGLTTTELIRLNPDLARRPKRLIRGEYLNVNATTDSTSRPAYRWIFTGGDPAGVSLVKAYNAGQTDQVNDQLKQTLTKQIPQFTGIPADIRERFSSQLEWQSPRLDFVRSTVDSPLVLNGLVFGGYTKGSKTKYWDGTVICLWTDPTSKRPAPDQLVAQFDPVVVDGTSYQLVAFLECQNAAVIRRELPPEPVVVMPPETTYVAPPPPPPPLPLPPIEHEEPPPPLAPPTRQEVTNRYYPYNQAGWLTAERVQIDPNGQSYNQRVQNNLFAGYERTFWFNRFRNFGIRGRINSGYFDLDAIAFDANIGGVVANNWETFRIDLEGGYGHTSQQRLYYRPEQREDLSFDWVKEKEWVRGNWPYLRAQLITGWLYVEGRHSFGTKYRNRLLQTTLRPGNFYAKAAFDEQNRGGLSRAVDEREVIFQPDRIRMVEGRLGYQLGLNWTLYGSYDVWRHVSPYYRFRREGPGGGFEWHFLTGNNNWRLDGKLSRFTAHDDATWAVERNGARSYDRHLSENQLWRGLLGIVYTPTTRWHGLKKR